MMWWRAFRGFPVGHSVPTGDGRGSGKRTSFGGEEVRTLRTLFVAAGVLAMLVFTIAPALAAPNITVDGDLSDWGVDVTGAYPDDWLPELTGAAFVLDDDVVHNTYNCGGEWYDIEALYLSLDTDGDTQYLSWALVTSYAGAEPPESQAAGDPIGYRNNTYGTNVGYPYRRHPVLALAFNGDPWSHGIIMAPGYDWEWNTEETATDFTNSRALEDVKRASSDASWDEREDDRVPSIADTPQLWAVPETNWRGAHPLEFGNQWDKPIDFDVRSGSGNTDLSVTGDVYAGPLYLEDAGSAQNGQTYWKQQDNWVWEGYVEFPKYDETSQPNGVTFDAHTTVSFTYGVWCANNHTYGDSVSYGDPDDDSPELATWMLLGCTAGLGGLIRRRRKD